MGRVILRCYRVGLAGKIVHWESWSFAIESELEGSWIDLEGSDGEQSFLLDGVEMSLPVDISAAGEITYEPEDLVVEPVLDYFLVGEEEWVMSVTID